MPVAKKKSTAKNSNHDTADGDKSANVISIVGARTHNLKNVSVDIPRDALVVITGPSGSGKSSLAIDTLFAEGQRQYVESLSIYSRQFFSQNSRTEVDFIEGLQPTISLDQNGATANPRSTVGTVSEIYDYLRVLMARAGDIRCTECGSAIAQQTKEQIAESIGQFPNKTKIMMLAPMVVGRKGKHEDVFQAIRRERLVRVQIDGETYDIDELPELDVRKNHTIDAVTDRIIIRDDESSRLFESIELAEKLSDGLVGVSYRLPDSKQWQQKIFSTRYACPQCDVNYPEIEPRTFSFNSPYGACPECTGLGVLQNFDVDLVMPDRSLSIADGAIVPWAKLTPKKKQAAFDSALPVLAKLKFSLDRPLDKLKNEKIHELLHHADPAAPGLFVLLQKELATCTNQKRLEQLETFVSFVECHVCQGSRLAPTAGAVTIAEQTVSQICDLPIEQSLVFFEQLNFEETKQLVASPLVKEITKRLKFLELVGVGYLTLHRAADSLSGGELQRVRLATAIGGGLTNVCYVLDEPSIGLHQRDNGRLINALTDLKSNGNSLVVVEHDEEMIRAADYVIDVGPSAGTGGGEIVALGTVAEIEKAKESITGDYLSGRRKIEIPTQRRKGQPEKRLCITDASGFNLKNVDAEIPLGVFNCITGVSGSGKSTLINQTLAPAIRRYLGLKSETFCTWKSVSGLEHIDRLIQIDQKPIGRTPRGCAATYTGVFAEIRKIFAATKLAKQRGFSASRFSFNTRTGWCAECQGYGSQKITMNFLPDIFVQCDACAGRRFNLPTLDVRFSGVTIADVLEMPVSQARLKFENIPKIHSVLKSMEDVGLGYLPLGQPSTKLSGGEAQRIKLATELSRAGNDHAVFLLDEPTTGLHFEDIRRLLAVLNQLVDAGNTVIVIEHNLDVIKCADWVTDLGPEGGMNGGQIVATGTPEDVAAKSASFTGQYLQELLG